MAGDSPDSSAREALERRLAGLSPAKRALLLAQAGFAPVVAKTATIPTVPRDTDARLSYGQELLWLIEQSTPGHAYNVPRMVRLRGDIDLNALQFAVNALVERHEPLRTTYHAAPGHPVQRIGAPKTVPIHVVGVASEDDARIKARELSRMPFDLANDSQLRVSLIRIAPDDHVLHIASHHIASDGWSGNILLRELAALYDAKRAGKTATLPELPVQYIDFAEWQRKTLSDDRLASLIAWWRDNLAGAPKQLDLPTDRARVAGPGFDGASQGRTLDARVATNLKALAQSLGATPFMVHIAAVFLVLNRYTDEQELIIGTPVAGRTLPEVEGVVGFFANTLLLRASLAGSPTFRELISRVRTASLGAFDHQEIPFETLLATRDENNQPIIAAPQVVFLADDPERAPFHLPGTESVPFGGSRGATKFDLTLRAQERPDGVRLTAEYRTDLFDVETIERLLKHYGTLLSGALETPDVPIDDLSMLDADDARRAIHEWNDTDARYPENATIHGLIEAQVDRRPDAIAVECTIDGVREALTYRELERRANRVASTLRNADVQPDERVGVIVEKSINNVVAILGVLKAGAAYLPIDPNYPDERIAFTVSDAGARIMLTDADNRERLAALGIAARAIDVDDAIVQGTSESRPSLNVSPRHMAYVIYTSGSTGRPKGCMIEHRNVTRLLVNDHLQFDFDENDVWTIFHSFAFDFSVWEMFGALVYGGRCVVVPRVVAQSPTDFLALLESTGTTILCQVPSAFQALMEEAARTRPTLAVRYVIFGGEALKPALLKKWRTYKPDTRLINMFGITETTVHVTFKEIGDEEIAAGVSNIGRPIPTTTVYMLDRQLRPVPVGVRGEICVGGLGVARGYLNRPELNAERFIADPFVQGGTLYRSGDLGRQLANGEIEYIGRRDHQVKIRGHRIELGEIEAVLLQQLDVAEAVVMVREDTPGDQRLVAYVVAEPFKALDAVTLRDGMRERLTEIMVPTAIEFLHRLPLTGNGKVDLRALPAPKHVGTAPYQYPRTTTEYEIAKIWEKLLKPGRPVGAFDDFFELGGHSLLAMQMLVEIERVRGQRIPFAWLLESSTVEALANRLTDPLIESGELPLVALNKETAGAPFAYLHGDWTGVGWYSRRLAKLATPDSPFYVLATVGTDKEEFPWTIELMAAKQVEELRRAQPQGPYRIGGFCVGGVVAFEMARQLQEAGEKVDRLVIVDSGAVNARLGVLAQARHLVTSSDPIERLEKQASLLHRLRVLANKARIANEKPLATRARWLVRNVARRIPLVKQLVPQGDAAVTQNGAAAAAAADGDEIVMWMQRRATSAYVPRHYHGTIDLIWASGAPGKALRANPLDGWRRVSDNVRLHTIPAVHIGLITEELPRLAETLKDILSG